MATFDLGRVTPIYKGDYEATASYELNDVVLYNGNLYWHIQAIPTTGILPSDSTVWKLAFADEGIRSEIRGYADDAQASADNASAFRDSAAMFASNAQASASQADTSAQAAMTARNGAAASAQTASTQAQAASASAQSAQNAADTFTSDPTLSVSGKAADAKSVGDELAVIKSGLYPYSAAGYYRSSFRQKRLSTAIGQEVTSSDATNRIAIVDLQYANADITFSVASGFQFGIMGCDKDNILRTDSGWQRGSYTVQAGTYFHVLMSRTNTSADITPADAENLSAVEADFSGVRITSAQISDLYERAEHQRYDFASLLMGKNAYIDYDTAAGTITIPGDTLYCDYNADGTVPYKQLSSGNLVITGINEAGTGALKLVLDTDSWEVYLKAYGTRLTKTERLIATIRTNRNNNHTPSLGCPSPWSINGKPYGIETKSGALVKGINHRGWNTAPENTLPAYKLSKAQGFEYVETDVRFTSDGVPVLLHDESINRTGRNADGSTISETVNIGDITYAEVLEYDFGAYKSDFYAGTKIGKFEDFIKLCRNIGLKVYIELKTGTTDARVQELMGIVNRNGMRDNVTWISFYEEMLGYVKSRDSKARLGLISNADVSSGVITKANALKTSDNDVFINVNYQNLTTAGVELCSAALIPLEVWTVNSASIVNSLDTYITGVSSDYVNASRSIYESNI